MKKIREIFEAGKYPAVKLLAYNLEQSKPHEVYAIIERTLQNTFGIQKIWDSHKGRTRLDESHRAYLLQSRNDASKFPTLSLDSAYCKAVCDTDQTIAPTEIANLEKAPVLLVGLSQTYDASFSRIELAEMARQWWKLSRLKGFEVLSTHGAAILAAWSSAYNIPQIVGIWRISPSSFSKSEKDQLRYSCKVMEDSELTSRWLGKVLKGELGGRHYFGPHIYI